MLQFRHKWLKKKILKEKKNIIIAESKRDRQTACADTGDWQKKQKQIKQYISWKGRSLKLFEKTKK